MKKDIFGKYALIIVLTLVIQLFVSNLCVFSAEELKLFTIKAKVAVPINFDVKFAIKEHAN